MTKKIILLFAIFSGIEAGIVSQVVYEHSSSVGIYSFLDELAGEKIISTNSSVLPWSRQFIADCLDSAYKKQDLLSPRQQKELQFFCRAYVLENGGAFDTRLDLLRSKAAATSLNPPAVLFRDSLFRFQFRPIIGGQMFFNEAGDLTHRWWVASFHATMGKHLAIYANLRDNWETEILAKPTYFTQRIGGNYKVGEGGRPGGDFSEMRGGITYGWKWGSIGLLKDHVRWGSGYAGSMILSGRTPSFAHIRLQLKPTKWAELNYIHGWLISQVIDSSRSYYVNPGNYRAVYREKYIASNFITITPWKHFNFSFGNSIIYSDNHVQPALLIPVMFYKSVDHTISNVIYNHNSQMFLDLSIRSIQHVHLYGSLFVDEWMTRRVWDKELHNFLGYKGGMKLSGWPASGVSFTAEYSRTSPVTYKHSIASATYASNKFNLGYYLGDNSEELYLALNWKPFRGMQVLLEARKARHGNEYSYLNGGDAIKYPVLEDITWENKTVGASLQYEILPDFYWFVSYLKSDVQAFQVDGQDPQYYLDLYTPAFFQGKKSTLSGGFALGF